MPPNLCVALEDTEIGLISGKTAGMKVIAIPNKYTKNQDFSRADMIVGKLSDVTTPLLLSL